MSRILRSTVGAFSTHRANLITRCNSCTNAYNMAARMQDFMTITLSIFYFYRAIGTARKAHHTCYGRINFGILQIKPALPSNIIEVSASMRPVCALLAIVACYMRLLTIYWW
ncbi:hypothetical protein AO391_24945 [Pseudomonas marginalis ICMP 9505]|nr:hypothetical protein AO391_24945 [Pseudomonas marginalis ICMP 9505]